MQGSVSHETGLLLGDILQLLCHTRQVGCLQLTSPAGGEPIRINMGHGRLLNATYGAVKNEAAVLMALGEPELDFLFLPGLSDHSEGIRESLASMLMRANVDINRSFAIEGPPPDGDATLLEYEVRNGVASGGFSEEDAAVFMEDLEFFKEAIERVAMILDEKEVTEIGVMEPGQSTAFLFSKDLTAGVVGVNACLELTVAAAREIKRRRSA